MESDSLKAGDKIGPYKIVRKIGQGGMGEVYEAFEESLQRPIAVKILSGDASNQPDLVRRFKTEGRALARLEHANIVRVYILDEHEGRVYMAMEYIDGWTLDEYLRTHYFGLDEVLRLARHLLEGLASAHSAGIIHRDIKPQNIMVDRQLNTKLLDFGIAKVNEDNGGVNTVNGVMFGTLNYIAPEIFNGVPATKQSDIYSLGLVFYLMFSGKSPFSGKTRLEIVEKVANTKVTFAPESNAILPPALKKVIYRMIAKNLDERYTSARDALSDLEKVNLNALPRDLRPSLSAHMNIVCPDDLRAKCVNIGLEYFEIRLVVCLAAEITLKAQTWAGHGNMIVGPQAMTEAARRYVFAKRQMIVRNAYRDSNLMLAIGGLVTAIIFAAVVVGTVLNSEKQKTSLSPVIAPPPFFATQPVALPTPLAAPVAPQPVAASASTPPLPPPPLPLPEVKPEEVRPAAKASREVSRAQIKQSSSPKKIAKVSKPRNNKKKDIAKRAPASAHNSDPAAPSEPDFLQQKPVLLPTVIDRRNH